jgi:molybdopterin synthase catalytic subunit
MENEALELQEGECYVGLTHDYLNVQNVMDRVRSPQAGAIVIFAGMFTTTT